MPTYVFFKHQFLHLLCFAFLAFFPAFYLAPINTWFSYFVFTDVNVLFVVHFLDNLAQKENNEGQNQTIFNNETLAQAKHDVQQQLQNHMFLVQCYY